MEEDLREQDEVKVQPEAETQAEQENAPEVEAEQERASEAETEQENAPEPEAEQERAPEAETEQELAPEPEEETQPRFTEADLVMPGEGEGLSTEQAEGRRTLGLSNVPVDAAVTTLKDIVKSNVCTYFNLIFLIITICLCLVGSFRDLTFLPVIIANTLIGIVQEWRSRQLLDKLKMISAPRSRVIRDGKEQSAASDELVRDDLVIFDSGCQIPADAVLEEGSVQVNEALLTGEADLITKEKGDELLSGSFVVSGECRARLTKVGEHSYISRLTLDAKRTKGGEQSEMIRSLERLVKIVGILIIPIAALLFSQQYFINHQPMKQSVTATVAAIIGMIPEGLFLLASVAMAVSAMRLAFGKVLVHNMKSIETLARADVLCVDKTGTITENRMTVRKTVPLRPVGDAMAARAITDTAMDAQAESAVFAAGSSRTDPAGPGQEEMAGVQADTGTVEDSDADEATLQLELWIGDFAACMSSDNITIRAIKSYYTKQTGRRPEKIVPFSPVYKYSGAVFDSNSYVLGAPEFVLGDQYPVYARQIEKYSLYGYRVLVFGRYPLPLDGGALKQPALPLGLILMMNPVRENAAQTFRYFEEEGVAVKVISGDNPLTVSEVAQEAGIRDAQHFVDCSVLSEDELAQAAEEYTVFGRVSPEQKRTLITALQKAGHTVAMTGDGVNDVLALKEADCSIAMASGSDAAAQIAQMVLLESDFSRMPSVVAEGRRVVNNIERTASLFLVKNIFSLLMSVFSIVFMIQYPLQPSQVSLISMFTIGIPAFVMSLETNRGRIQGHFLGNVFYRALPAGLTDFIVISVLVIFCREFRVSATDLSTSCMILLAIVGIMILYRIASPMTKFHWILWFGMIFGILFCMIFMNRIFSVSMISRKSAMLLIIFAALTEPLLRYLSRLTGWVRQLFRWTMRRIRESREKQENLFSGLG